MFAVAAERTLLHVRRRDAEIAQDLAELDQVGACSSGERMSGSETISIKGTPER